MLRQNGKVVQLTGIPDDGGAWLERRLKSLYESVINEPLPDDIRRLLESQK